jgi:hypothetical protein
VSEGLQTKQFQRHPSLTRRVTKGFEMRSNDQLTIESASCTVVERRTTNCKAAIPDGRFWLTIILLVIPQRGGCVVRPSQAIIP